MAIIETILNCLQIKDWYQIELLVGDRNVWNNLAV